MRTATRTPDIETGNALHADPIQHVLRSVHEHQLLVAQVRVVVQGAVAGPDVPDARSLASGTVDHDAAALPLVRLGDERPGPVDHGALRPPLGGTGVALAGELVHEPLIGRHGEDLLARQLERPVLAGGPVAAAELGVLPGQLLGPDEADRSRLPPLHHALDVVAGIAQRRWRAARRAGCADPFG